MAKALNFYIEELAVAGRKIALLEAKLAEKDTEIERLKALSTQLNVALAEKVSCVPQKSA